MLISSPDLKQSCSSVLHWTLSGAWVCQTKALVTVQVSQALVLSWTIMLFILWDFSALIWLKKFKYHIKVCINGNGRRTGLVTFCVKTAFYNGLSKERYKEVRSDRKTRKKTYEATGWPYGNERILSFEGGCSGSHHVESSLWTRLRTFCKTAY